MTVETVAAPAPGPILENASRSSLAIIEEVFRGGMEEQYANIVWLSECMKQMRANHNLLLMGAAVGGVLKGQTRKSITIGSITIETVTHLPDAVTGVMEKGARIWVLQRDLDAFGPSAELIEGVEVAQSAAALIAAHEKAWFW
ncbi:MAG: hypothetical protein AAFQ51_07815 [Pseudomonadota bacterium]